jgi:hypothetical protein
MQVGGVYARFAGQTRWHRTTQNTTWYTQQPYAEANARHLGFAWGGAAELLVVFGCPFSALHRWPDNPIRFPARIYVKEPHLFGLLENDGPSYPVEGFSLEKNRSIQAMSGPELQQALQASGVLANGEIMEGVQGISLRNPCSLWAVRVAFKYHVEGKDGTMKEKSGLRPFGGDYLGPNDDYTYHFDIRSPPVIGLDLRDVLRLKVPGIPDGFLSDTALAGDKDWVTNKALWPLTELEKLQVKK